MVNEGIDKSLAFHIATLFGRDPIPAYSKEFEESEEPSTAHFENLQTTNWNSMRLKPPPTLTSPIGWRVEFRSMDIQLTDYENTAMIVLLLMLTNVINNFDVDFIVPISMADDNMERAHDIDAILTQKFWVKTKGSIVPGADYTENILEESDYTKSANQASNSGEKEVIYEELSII